MSITVLRKFIGQKLFGNDVIETIALMKPFLKKKYKILDLGAGTCQFTKLLREEGYNIEPVDVKDYNYYPEIKVRVYDGKHLPFKDNEFDVCILRAVLHHTPNPNAVLEEAERVSRRLIIFENVITNPFQKYYTFFVDSVMNKELIAPHTNKTDKEWKLLFKHLKLSLVETIRKTDWLFMQDRIYFLQKI
ncbi:MAG: class I SAM-dependent methyltransferase [Candidatus Levybacteria bacterium]|nr:class I SAM-dependent methyltransferase [Candidatus Levybacteria bacterium]